MTPPCPPSTVAYPLLNQLLDSLMPLSVSSTASTFTLTSMLVSSCDAATTTTSLPVSSATAITSTSTLPPISSLMTASVQTSSSPIHSSSNLPPSSSFTAGLPLLSQDAVATSPHLQQYSAVRQLTHELQLRKHRHPKRTQLPPGEAGTPVRRIVHTAVYKQKLHQYNQTLKLYEDHIDELLKQTTAELDKFVNNVDSVATILRRPSKLRKFKSPEYKISQLSPLRIQILSHNCLNCSNCPQCYTPHCSHVLFNYSLISPFPSAPSSPALIPIRYEPITPPNPPNPPTPSNDLEILLSSLNDFDYYIQCTFSQIFLKKNFSHLLSPSELNLPHPLIYFTLFTPYYPFS